MFDDFMIKLKLKVGSGGTGFCGTEKAEISLIYMYDCRLTKSILKFTFHLLDVSFCEDNSQLALSS